MYSLLGSEKFKKSFDTYELISVFVSPPYDAYERVDWVIIGPRSPKPLPELNSDLMSIGLIGTISSKI